MTERKALFDSWAETYDETLEDTSGFPFEGYARLLAEVVGGSAVEKGGRVLDIGTGTGALAARFAASGAQVLGVDFSEAMLVQARLHVPEVQFAPLELLGSWDVLDGWRFDAVVSAYVLHEFTLPLKREVLRKMAGVLEPTGRIVVGDISFETAAALGAAKRRWETVWDESEHYWVAEEMIPVLERAGFGVRYRQISFCGGIYTLIPAGREG